MEKEKVVRKTRVVTAVFGPGSAVLTRETGKHARMTAQCKASLPPEHVLDTIWQDDWGAPTRFYGGQEESPSTKSHKPRKSQSLSEWVNALGAHVFPEDITVQQSHDDPQGRPQEEYRSRIHSFGCNTAINFYGTCLTRYLPVDPGSPSAGFFKLIEGLKNVEEASEPDVSEYLENCATELAEPVAIVVLSSRPLADLWKPILSTLDSMIPPQASMDEIVSEWLPTLHKAIVNNRCLGCRLPIPSQCTGNIKPKGDSDHEDDEQGLLHCSEISSTGEGCLHPHIIELQEKEFMIPPLRPHYWECPKHAWRCPKCECKCRPTSFHAGHVLPRNIVSKRCLRCTAEEEETMIPEEQLSGDLFREFVCDDRSVCADLLDGPALTTHKNLSETYNNLRDTQRKHFQFMFCKSGTPRNTLPRSDIDEMALLSQMDPYKIILMYNAFLVGKNVIIICDHLELAYDCVMALSSLVWPLKPPIPGTVSPKGFGLEFFMGRQYIFSLPRERLRHIGYLCQGEDYDGNEEDYPDCSCAGMDETYAVLENALWQGEEAPEPNFFLADVDRNDVSYRAVDPEAFLAVRHSIFLYERICRDCPLFPHVQIGSPLPPHPPLLHAEAHPQGVKQFVAEKIEHVSLLFRDWPLRLLKREILSSIGHDNLRRRVQDNPNKDVHGIDNVKGWNVIKNQSFYDFHQTEGVVALPFIFGETENLYLCDRFAKSQPDVAYEFVRMSEHLKSLKDNRSSNISYSKGVARAIDSDDEMFETFEISPSESGYFQLLSPWELWRSHEVNVGDLERQEALEQLWSRFCESTEETDLPPWSPFTYPRTPDISFCNVRMAFLSVFVSLFKAFRYYINFPADLTPGTEAGNYHRSRLLNERVSSYASDKRGGLMDESNHRSISVEGCPCNHGVGNEYQHSRHTEQKRSVASTAQVCDTEDTKTPRPLTKIASSPTISKDSDGAAERKRALSSHTDWSQFLSEHPDLVSTESSDPNRENKVDQRIARDRFVSSQSRHGDQKLLQRAVASAQFEQFCITRFAEERPFDEIDRGGIDIFDDLCFSALSKRERRQSNMKNRPYWGFLYKAIAGTKCKSVKHRYFTLYGNVLCYFKVDDELYRALESVRQERHYPWENEVVKSRYRGRFELRPRETYLQVPSFSETTVNTQTAYPFQVINSDGNALTLYAKDSRQRVAWIEHINARLKLDAELTKTLYYKSRDDRLARRLRVSSDSSKPLV
eukprot:gb/GECG01016570.1/.p1 GENE.gb/GECG01016570.1/~~gb/GECG01016570.1/.p1  ORF type:complete len:1227 (+),score=110.65 gb/GECG01016570.1/:1-3681(+)